MLHAYLCTEFISLIYDKYLEVEFFITTNESIMTYNEIMLSNILKEFLKNFPVILLCSLGWDLNLFLFYYT